MLESVDTVVMWKISHASQENPRLLKRIGQLFYRTLMENRIWSSYFLLLTPNAETISFMLLKNGQAYL